MYPLSALFAALVYQGMDPALYYLIGIGVYFWAYAEGEVGSVRRMLFEFEFEFC